MEKSNRFLLKAQNAIRFSPEDIEYMSGEILNIFPDYDELTTFKRVFSDLFTRATAIHRKSTGSQPADVEKIQNLQNEIGLLKTAASLQKEEHEKLESEFCRLVESQAPTAGPDQLILTLKPEIFAVLQKEREQAKRKNGKEYTDNDIVNLHFWNLYRNGVSYPLFTWDEFDRAKFKKQQNQNMQNVGNPE